MLNAFYTTLFKPGDTRLSVEQLSAAIGLLVILVLSLNAAGRFQAGLGGLIVILLLFSVVALLNLFWQTAALLLCAQVFGGQGTGRQTALALARGLWPLLFSGVAIATAKALPALGKLETFIILVGTAITLTGCLRQVHQLGWPTAAICLTFTLFTSPIALFGLLFWPVVLSLGT